MFAKTSPAFALAEGQEGIRTLQLDVLPGASRDVPRPVHGTFPCLHSRGGVRWDSISMISQMSDVYSYETSATGTDMLDEGYS